MRDQPIERIVDLIDPSVQRIPAMSVDQARERIRLGTSEAVSAIPGSFALVARDGDTVRMARSLDRPMRYFLAKRTDGPMLVVADRIDAIYAFLRSEGLDGQFHPTYTRMVPAHHVVEIRLLGCPDPDASYTRFLEPEPAPASMRTSDPSAAATSARWPTRSRRGSRALRERADRRLLLGRNRQRRGLPDDLPRPAAAGSLSVAAQGLHAVGGGGEDLEQARRFLEALSLGLFLEPVEVPAEWIDPLEAVRVIEDYKPLDVESAAASLALLRGLRARYPEWKHLIDGDGGDENLKDYPIEENPELTIRSVVSNPFLYQEGWGVGTFKHSRTYSGGQSRACTRTYAPTRRYGFEGFSPFTRPNLVRIAAGLPFAALAGGDVERLYALKGEIVGRGIRELTGFEMPIFPKRRFQHGAVSTARRAEPASYGEADYRRQFLGLYA